MPADSPFLRLADDRVLILDGGMGTSLHEYHPTDADWGYSPTGKSLMNLSDTLVYTRPDWIREIHAGYFAAGCDELVERDHELILKQTALVVVALGPGIGEADVDDFHTTDRQ